MFVYSCLQHTEQIWRHFTIVFVSWYLRDKKFKERKHHSQFVIKSTRPIVLVHQVIFTRSNYKQTVPQDYFTVIISSNNARGESMGVFHMAVISCHGNMEKRFVGAAVCFNLTWYDQMRWIIYQCWDLNILYLRIIFQRRDQQVWGEVHQLKKKKNPLWLISHGHTHNHLCRLIM